MPYYSVYITDGKDQLAAGKKARDAIGGKAADYTGGTNLFYVHKLYDKAKLTSNVQSIVGSSYKVKVTRVSKAVYDV